MKRERFRGRAMGMMVTLQFLSIEEKLLQTLAEKIEKSGDVDVLFSWKKFRNAGCKTKRRLIEVQIECDRRATKIRIEGSSFIGLIRQGGHEYSYAKVRSMESHRLSSALRFLDASHIAIFSTFTPFRTS